MGFISTKLRNSARGQPCTLAIPGHCQGGTETTVLCHAPSEIKGLGNKSHDFHAAFGCVGCHTALDQHKLPKADEAFYWLRGVMRTQSEWLRLGLMFVAGVDADKPKTRPKKPTKWPTRKLESRSTFAKGPAR